MFRVTTPTHKFIFSEPVADCTELLATYSQYGQIVLGRSGTAVIFPTQGAIQIREMNGVGSTYTLASGSTLNFSFLYLR